MAARRTVAASWCCAAAAALALTVVGTHSLLVTELDSQSLAKAAVFHSPSTAAGCCYPASPVVADIAQQHYQLFIITSEEGASNNDND